MRTARESDQQTAERISVQDDAISRIRKVCESYELGGMSYRHAVQTIEELMDMPTRIVRVGRQHDPEVTT